MTNTSGMGFPTGRVAQALRKILYPELTDHEVEAIIVCLMAHLLIEDSLNGVIYRWLKQDAPISPDTKIGSQATDKLWKNILKMDFAKKYSLIQPFFAVCFPNEEVIPWKINDLRNTIFHGKAIRDAEYKNQLLSEEATVEKIFLDAQTASRQLAKFEEMVDGPHATAERWRKRLEELGEPLF
jgi:hypothetical protein